MKRYPSYLTNLVTYLLIHLLIFIIFITGLGCGLALNLTPQLSGLMSEPTPSRTWRRVSLPTLTPTPAPISEASQTSNTQTAPQRPAQWPNPVVSPTLLSNVAPPAIQVTATFSDFRPIQAGVHQPAPSATPVLFEPEPAAISTQSTPLAFTATPSPTFTPRPTVNISPVHTPLSHPMPTPSPTLTPWPGYDFMLAEFYNSPTTNSFLLVYVAVVDPQEIPIGDMKIVGTRLDHNLTYESPLTTWHYEGYNAPGEHIKSGNVKFEPPGGIESTSWLLHLEDARGQRQSEDIPFDVDENNKQWYFIKFRRKF